MESSNRNPVSDKTKAVVEEIKKQFRENPEYTEYGEPQVWYALANGRSIEVTKEMEMLPVSRYFYSARSHCSEEEFDADDFHATLGVIDSFASSSLSEEDLESVIRSALYSAEHVQQRHKSLFEQIKDAEARSQNKTGIESMELDQTK